MTGYSDTYTPSSIVETLHIAADVKEESGFLSGLYTINVFAMALVAALAVILIVDLAWRERRQHRREKPVESTPEADPHEGDISP